MRRPWDRFELSVVGDTTPPLLSRADYKCVPPTNNSHHLHQHRPSARLFPKEGIRTVNSLLLTHDHADATFGGFVINGIEPWSWIA